MHARMVTAQVSPFKMDEGVRVYREQVVPEAMKLKGFRNAFLLTGADGAVVSLVLWETEADMLAGETSTYMREQFARFGAIFNGPPSIEHYEVTVQV